MTCGQAAPSAPDRSKRPRGGWTARASECTAEEAVT
jgi:hypothetical protein